VFSKKTLGTTTGSTTPTLKVAGDIVETTETDAAGHLVVRFCSNAPAFPRTGFTTLHPPAGEQSASLCFDPTQWKSVALGAGGTTPVYTTAGTPNPEYGPMAAQGMGGTNSGLSFWSCAQAFQGQTARDCSVATNWFQVSIPGGTAVGQIDILPTSGGFGPITNANQETQGVYISYFDQNWEVQACHNWDEAAVPPSGTNWLCEEREFPDGGGPARGWGGTLVEPGVDAPMSSTLRVVNYYDTSLHSIVYGDLTALFLENGRAVLATCPGGGRCSRIENWRVVPAATGFNMPPPPSSGFLTSGWNGQLFMAYPNFNGSGQQVLDVLANGQFHGP
jgi:hypothetical protein